MNRWPLGGFWCSLGLILAGYLAIVGLTYVWRHYFDPVGVALDYFESHKEGK